MTGNLAAYERDRLGFLSTTHAKFGPVVTFDKRTTLVADPRLISDLLRSPDAGITHDFLLRPVPPQIAAQMSSGRELMYPATRKAESRRLGPSVAAELGAALDELSGQADHVRVTCEPMDLAEEVISKAINVYFLGRRGLQTTPLVRDLLDELSRLIGNTMAPPAAWRTPLRRRIEKRHRDLSALVMEELAHGNGDSERCVVRWVASHPRRTQFPDRLLADMIVGSLLASQRVPAAAAGWMTHLLARHPEAQDRIQTQIQLGYEPGGRYAEAVAWEALRLYPATWLLQRAALRPLRVAGYEFDAGHQFLMSPYVVHRSSAHFQAPGAFRPERWLTGHQGRTVKAGFLPFGDGLHLCPGRHLAVEALAALAETLCRTYRLREVGGVITADPRTTLKPVGSRIELTPRPTRRTTLRVLSGPSH